MAGNLNSGMCSPLCSDVCAFYLPQGLTIYIFFFLENKLRQYPILPISFVSERMCRYAATDAESSVSFYFHFL